MDEWIYFCPPVFDSGGEEQQRHLLSLSQPQLSSPSHSETPPVLSPTEPSADPTPPFMAHPAGPFTLRVRAYF